MQERNRVTMTDVSIHQWLQGGAPYSCRNIRVLHTPRSDLELCVGEDGPQTCQSDLTSAENTVVCI